MMFVVFEISYLWGFGPLYGTERTINNRVTRSCGIVARSNEPSGSRLL